ncbi:MAG: type II secretion system protein [Victivallales bacterium]|nr:type II secretion system protein [Victivallales bacterium]
MSEARHNSAFTLLELVIVMAVVGTTLAVTAPNLARFVHGRSVQEEARRFVAVTRRAAVVAASQSCRTLVWLDPETGEYGWRRVETYDEEGVGDVSFTVADGMVLEVSPQPEEETCEVTFLPHGTVEGADELRVCFVSGPGEDSAEVGFDDERGIFVVQSGEDAE